MKRSWKTVAIDTLPNSNTPLAHTEALAEKLNELGLGPNQVHIISTTRACEMYEHDVSVLLVYI